MAPAGFAAPPSDRILGRVKHASQPMRWVMQQQPSTGVGIWAGRSPDSAQGRH
jgi:hypothetical protein